MKNDRQAKILEIISTENIETQEQLLDRLQAHGITSTQATISRDIKQLHLIKEPMGQGMYKYAVSGNRTKLNFAERLRTIFRESITSIDSAQNIVVIKTMCCLRRHGRHGLQLHGGLSGRRRHGLYRYAGHGIRTGILQGNQGNAVNAGLRLRRGLWERSMGHAGAASH
jgi:hypothetical protein